jgi:glycosyltransferase involved in cell wall biosynthesis
MKRLGTTFQLRFTSGLRNIKSRQLTDNMIPLGKITDERKLVETYRECDALLFPSRLEGCSLVALEAMACGKPVIATNVSSVAEVVADRTTGILCPLDNVDAFAAACQKLAGDSQTRSAFGKAAREQAEESFSEERIVPQYVALYEKLAGGRGT